MYDKCTLIQMLDLFNCRKSETNTTGFPSCSTTIWEKKAGERGTWSRAATSRAEACVCISRLCSMLSGRAQPALSRLTWVSRPTKSAVWSNHHAWASD